MRARLKFADEKAIEADFHLDTGSSHVLTVWKSFVDQYQMLARVPDLQPGKTIGIGGSSPDMVWHVESVGLGSFLIRNPEVRFSTHAAGPLASARFAANLDNGFMSAWTVIFDIPHSRLMLIREILKDLIGRFLMAGGIDFPTQSDHFQTAWEDSGRKAPISAAGITDQTGRCFRVAAK